MQVSGLTRSTPSPPGGEILKDVDGEPTGLLREKAESLIEVGAGEPSSPEERRKRARRVLELADREVLSKGITSFHDAGTSFATIDLMRSMVDERAFRKATRLRRRSWRNTA
jgi:predicted amidohydrolase YtcJ